MIDQRSSSPASHKGEEVYIGKPPSYLVGYFINRTVAFYALILVVVRLAGSYGYRLLPSFLEPYAIDFVCLVFPAFRIQYGQLATLADVNTQAQYLAAIFLSVVLAFGVMVLCMARYAKAWRRLAAPDWRCYFVIVVVVPALFWALTYEKFKKTVSLTALFYDDSFGWFFIRQVWLVMAAQVTAAIAILTLTHFILMRTKSFKTEP